MGILWASNSHPPQRDLAHGCSRSDPGLNKTALLWFWLVRFRLGMLWRILPSTPTPALLETWKPSPQLLCL